MASQQSGDSKQNDQASRKAAKPAAKVPSPQQGPDVVGPVGMEAARTDPSLASPSAILQMQRTAGNRAVRRLLSNQQIQTKLTVGAAGDKYEQEADQVAGQVMSATVTESAPPNQAQLKDDELQRSQLAGSISSLQRKESTSDAARAAGGSFDAGTQVEHRLETNKGGGKPLPSDTRSFMENRFGSDFSGVRVHTGTESVQLNRDLSAQAFTHGSHVYFGDGKYNPGTQGGKRLLAHELTHVVQQGGAFSKGGPVQRTTTQGVVQRSFGSWLKKTFGKSDKKDEGKKPEEGAKVDAPKTEGDKDKVNVSLQDAIAFEKKLGSFAFRHGKANAAAKAMTDKMTKALIGDVNKDDEGQQKQITEMYGKEGKATSAGQVGQDFQAVWDVLQQGNLRERLTALMNAMFGPFKQYLATAMQQSKWSEMQDKGLNVDKLKRRKRQLRFNPGAKDLYRDPGNPLDRKKMGNFEMRGTTRDAVEGHSERTVGGLEAEGTGLSDREKAYQFKDKGGEDVSGEKLKWQEGGTYWKMREGNKWVKKIQGSLQMPVMAGPSGSMLRMFQVWEYLNKPIPAAEWRLAVLGWMLSSNDHSFHEMMMTASDFGLPYMPGQRAYMDVNPLTVWELRQNVAKDGMFPHELAFQRKTESGGFNMMDSDSIDDAKSDAKKTNKDDGASLSAAGAAAIQLYTSFGYLILNPSRKGGMLAKKQIERAIQNKPELKSIKKKVDKGEVTVDQLIAEAKEIIPVLESALDTIPDWQGNLFRGTGLFNPFSFRVGSEISFGAFTSSTLDEDVAKGFADDYNIGPFKYILDLKVTAGKDIRKVSVANEDEILLPPGSKFVVRERRKPTPDDKYYRIKLEQTAKGGGKLELGTKVDDGLKVTKDSSGGKAEKQDKPELAAYMSKTDTDPAIIIPWADKDYISNEAESGEWTVFTHMMNSTDYWVKTQDLNDFYKPPAKEPEPKVEAADPLKGTLNASESKPVEFFSGMDSTDLTAPIGLTIMDENYQTMDEYAKIMVKLDDGQMGDVYKDQLMAAWVSSAAPKSIIESEKAKAIGSQFAHIANGKHNLTLPAGKKIYVYTSFDGTDVQELTMPIDQSVRLIVLEPDKAQGRCKIDIMGTGKGYYIDLKDIFDKEGKPSAAIEHGGKVVELEEDESEGGELDIVPETAPTQVKAPLAFVDDPDVSEEAVGTLSKKSEIQDPDFSSYTKEGVVWVNILIKGGSFVYVKKTALDIFMAD